MTESHSVLGLRVWPGGQPFRLAPAWAVLGGALASGQLSWSRNAGLLLLLALVLADGLWGQVWSLLAADRSSGQRETGPASIGRSVLPYATASSPAERISRWLASSRVSGTNEPEPATWGELLLLSVFCFGMAAFLGPAAVGLTAAAFLVAVLARGVASSRSAVAGCQGCFEIGLPWLLGHVLYAGLTWSTISMVCGLGYVLWMSSSVLLDAKGARVLLALACGVPLACLMVAREPVALAVLAATLLPTLAELQRISCWQLASGSAVARRAALQPWWLAGMLITAWGLAGR